MFYSANAEQPEIIKSVIKKKKKLVKMKHYF